MIILYSLSLMSLIAITLFIPWQKGGYNIVLKGREADTISKGRVVIACVGGGEINCLYTYCWLLLLI